MNLCFPLGMNVQFCMYYLVYITAHFNKWHDLWHAMLYKSLLLLLLPQLVSLTIYVSLDLSFSIVRCHVWFFEAKKLFSRLRSSLWLQFKPRHIAAGAAYLASKFLNMDLTAHQNIWQEFQATPSILRGYFSPTSLPPPLFLSQATMMNL